MTGETILHYKILEKIGEGGMGEVYKAQDTKLDRFVALKFLPSDITSSDEDRERFIQEAKAASAMNHPNVCTIHDIQEHNGQLFIVMEFVEGKTVREKKDSLSEKQILEIGIQVAEGLAAAHEKGIVHRDIKPENIMIRNDGIAQIMDFGLAKLYTDKNASRLTKVGTTMGTLGYMSPEQVQGLDVDYRTDIFSLGVVLYELLAGESPFKGVHETAIMYEIVNVDPPPISAVKDGIDPQIDEIILECLEKDKDERCQSAKELAKNLRKVKKSTGNKKSRIYHTNNAALRNQTNQSVKSKSLGAVTVQAFNKTFELNNIFSSVYLLWTLVGVLLLGLLYFSLIRENPKQNHITSMSVIDSPPAVDFQGNNGDPGDFEISHNGKSIVFVGMDSTGNTGLWLRTLNSENAKALPGTDGAFYPFWSYDDKSIAYFILDKLMKIDLNTGLSTEICKAQNGRGGCWNKYGDIVFAPAGVGGLYLVSSNGGVPKEIIKTDPAIKYQSLRFPFFLPDGKHFLYSIENDYYGASKSDVIKAGSINSDFDKVILHSSTNAEYANGYLFYTDQSALLCRQFDPDNFQLKGDIQTIAGDINYTNLRIKSSFSVSQKGNLVLQHSSRIIPTLTLLNLNGTERNLPVKTNVRNAPDNIRIAAMLSPDNEKILYSAKEKGSTNPQLWVYNIKTKINTRITFNADTNTAPCWSPDGKLVAFTSGRNVYIKDANGAGSRRLIYMSDSTYYKITDDWSSDGTKLLIEDVIANTGSSELIIVNIEDKHIRKYLVNNSFNSFVSNGRISKNMKWVLYTSVQSGTFQLYVRPLGKENGMWQISSNGGVEGWWVDNDKAIIYLTVSGKVYKVKVNGSGDNFNIGSPQYLFSIKGKNLSGLCNVSEKGNAFLGPRVASKAASPPLTYVQNWRGLLKGNSK